MILDKFGQATPWGQAINYPRQIMAKLSKQPITGWGDDVIQHAVLPIQATEMTSSQNAVQLHFLYKSPQKLRKLRSGEVGRDLFGSSA